MKTEHYHTLKFAIVMPLYNKGGFVRKAVESVVGQTFADWEMWVVDDGSTDESALIVQTFSDPRIHLVRQANAGVSAARNRGVALSSEAADAAPYLCFLDADDWWESTFLQEMADLIGRHPGAGLYATSYWIMKNGKRRVAPIGVEATFAEGEIDYGAVYARTLCMPTTSISVCMPRAVFCATSGFPEGITLGEDFLLWATVSLQHKVVLLNKPLATYNQDVPSNNRGTHHLTPPPHNFMWHLGQLADTPVLHPLLDRLLSYNLQPYYLSRHYHADSMTLLSTIDMSQAYPKSLRTYRQPLWLARLDYRMRRRLATLKNAICNLLPY